MCIRDRHRTRTARGPVRSGREAVTRDTPLDGFLDDYFAECDEHLAEARRHLLTLEAAVDSPATQRQPIDNLFRIFHSIKRISGMVELREAEELAQLDHA